MVTVRSHRPLDLGETYTSGGCRSEACHSLGVLKHHMQGSHLSSDAENTMLGTDIVEANRTSYGRRCRHACLHVVKSGACDQSPASDSCRNVGKAVGKDTHREGRDLPCVGTPSASKKILLEHSLPQTCVCFVDIITQTWISLRFLLITQAARLMSSAAGGRPSARVRMEMWKSPEDACSALHTQ